MSQLRQHYSFPEQKEPTETRSEKSTVIEKKINDGWYN